MPTDVQNRRLLRGVQIEMSSPAPSEEELEALRRRMVASAARHLPHADAEDATQQALLRVVSDRRLSAVPLRTRAHRKLKDVRAELFRDNQRKFEVAARPLPEADWQEDPNGEALVDPPENTFRQISRISAVGDEPHGSGPQDRDRAE